MEDLSQKLSQVAPVADDAMCQRLLPWVTLPTGMTSAGYPYLDRRAFEGFRDRVPHLFGMGEWVGPPLRAAWSECATEAGYVRLEAYSARTRTIYPYPRRDGHNPSISVNHFFVPRPIADELGLVD